MKVRFRHMIQGYTGRADDAIYVMDRQTGRVYIRSYPQRTVMEGNISFAEVMKNLRRLCPSEPYKTDFQMYVEFYNALPANRYNPVKSWNNLFMKMMYAMAKKYPDIDLKTLTKQEIYDRSLPCICIKYAVDAGLLPVVRGYDRFSNGI